MQQKLDRQQQQLSNLWEENRTLKQVKDDFIPGLLDRGLLSMDEEKNQINVVKDWEEHQEVLAKNSKMKMRKSQESQQEFEVLNKSDFQEVIHPSRKFQQEGGPMMTS